MVMLCQTINESELPEYANKPNKIGQIKLDGGRMTYSYGKMLREKDEPIPKDFTYKFPELTYKKVINAVLDGEVLAGNGRFEDTNGRMHLQDKLLIKIQSQKNPVFFHIFDVREINKQDVTKLPLKQRIELLKTLDLTDFPNFKIVPWRTDIMQLWKEVKEKKSEGIIIKDLNGVYEEKRSWNWIKCKNWKEAIVSCSKYEEMPHNKGITLTIDENNQRLACLGGQSKEVAEKLKKDGTIKVELQYLSLDPVSKAYRFLSFRGLVK